MVMISYQGRDYDDFDVEHAGLDELRQIKKKLDLTVRQLIAGLNEIDVDAMTAVRWVVRRQHDQRLVLDAGEKYDFWEWANAYLASRTAAQEREEEEEPDPTLAGTLPAGPTPASAGSSTPTSENSPSSTDSVSPGSAGSANGKPEGSPSLASLAM
jgi:hypothetical protein